MDITTVETALTGGITALAASAVAIGAAAVVLPVGRATIGVVISVFKSIVKR